ncbi:hypothetical protein DV515_00013448 [Chloebia gouldiae]|uniref:Uncharacterized protein n=1 Tax=Chloebia gouldiae TaxID=44316 RepID=A0A3L8S1D0_CHLGU|nr:hypothetical protein DV515_00013448 [Chloebia gouldiae]
MFSGLPLRRRRSPAGRGGRGAALGGGTAAGGAQRLPRREGPLRHPHCRACSPPGKFGAEGEAQRLLPAWEGRGEEEPQCRGGESPVTISHLDTPRGPPHRKAKSASCQKHVSWEGLEDTGNEGKAAGKGDA